MQLVYKGKTKDVYDKGNGNYVLKFKDDATGANGVFDPGANTVGVTIKGLGMDALKLTNYFYRMLEDMGVPTHFVDANLEDGTMEDLHKIVFTTICYTSKSIKFFIYAFFYYTSFIYQLWRIVLYFFFYPIA